MLERFFQLSAHGTSVRRELIAGLTTFAAMAYILAVNPGILANTGMDPGALVTATALAAALGTALMGLLTNYPVALAPGMGLNAFFAFTVVLTLGVPWQGALALVFWNGILFVILSVTGLRRRVAEAIPDCLKIGVQCGIGFFIAFLGLKNAGLVVAHPATLVSVGDFSSPTALLALGGLILTAALMRRGVPGSILIGIAAVTLLGLFVPQGEGMVTAAPDRLFSFPASLAPTFLQLDWLYPFQNFSSVWTVILALLFVDLFDTIGTLIGVSKRAGLVDGWGRLPKMGRALTADALATVGGAMLGTSTTTSYIESAAGIEAGGRTGLTALTTAACFLGALFLSPLILAIPAAATAPALILVGVLMLQGIQQADLTDLGDVTPMFVTLLGMPLMFSISEGLGLGFVVFAGLALLSERRRHVSPLTWLLAAVFVLHFLKGLWT